MLGFVNLIPLPIRIGLIVGATTLVIGGAWYIYRQIEQGGYDRAVAEIAAENQEAINRVRTSKSKLAACIDRGKSWDQSRGVCIE